MSTFKWGRSLVSALVVFGLVIAAFAGNSAAANAKPSTPGHGSAAVMAPAAAQKGAVVTNGVGYALKAGAHLRHLSATEWAGTLDNDGVPTLCPNYDYYLGLVQHLKKVTRLQGLNTPSSRLIFYLANKYVSTRSRPVAAALYAAVNLIVGYKSFLADWRAKGGYAAQLTKINKGIVPLAHAMLTEATNKSGGAPHVSITKAHPGQSGQLSVTYVSAKGQTVAGVPVNVTLAGTNQTHAMAARTNSRGVASFPFTATDPSGRVSYRGTVAPVQYTNATQSTVTGHYQRLVGAGTALVQPLKGSYVTSAGSGTAGSECITNCNGNSKITFCAPANGTGAYALQYGYHVTGSTVYHVVVTEKGGQGKTCVVFAGIDEQTYSFAHRYIMPHSKFSGWTSGPKPLVLFVDCPPWAKVSFNGTVSCPPSGVSCQTMSVTMPANAHANHMQRYILDGTTVLVAAGKSITFSVPHTGHEKLYIGVRKLRSDVWTNQQILPI